MGSEDIIEYVVVCSGIQWSFIAIWKCTPPIATPGKDILTCIGQSTVKSVLVTTWIERPPLYLFGF